MRPTARPSWVAAFATAILSLTTAVGCKKDKESLLIVTLSAAATDTTASMLTSVTLTVTDGASHSVTRTFPLKAGTGIPSAAPYETVGVYLDSDITGVLTVTAKAIRPDSCAGESGIKTSKIDAPGATASVTVPMKPDANVCPPDGGAAGATGMAGAGGAAGATGTAGASGTAGATGTGGGCVEINHDDTAGCGASCSSAQDVAVYGVAFSPKNSQLFVTGGNDGRVKVWQVSNGTPTPEGHVLTGTGVSVLAFSADGTLLAVGRLGGVEIWSVAGWTLLRTLSVTYDTFGVAFSPDGQQVISIDYNNASGTSGTVNSNLYVHNVTTVQPLHQVALTDAYSLAVSPTTSSGALPVAVTTTSGNALIYDLTSSGFTARTTLTVTSDGSYAETAQFSPQGSLLAAGGDDGLLHFWSVPVSAGAAPIAPDIDIFANTVASGLVLSVAFSSDGNYVAVGAGFYGSLTTWASASPRSQVGTEYDTPNAYDVVSVAVAPDNSLIVAGEADCGCVISCRQ